MKISDFSKLEFFERDDIPFARDTASRKCFRVSSDSTVKESPITFADLWTNGRAISKEEALRLAKASGD